MFADKVTSIFVPVVLGIAVLTFISWIVFPGFFNMIGIWAQGFLPWIKPSLSTFSLAIFATVAVLVIACPCALGLATPTALMVGSGKGAENGILIRQGAAIQLMKNTKVIVFDKTGTITKGKPEVTDIIIKNITSVINPPRTPSRIYWFVRSVSPQPQCSVLLHPRNIHSLKCLIARSIRRKRCQPVEPPTTPILDIKCQTGAFIIK